MSFKNIYRNKSVFITGHTGFKGAWLALWLTELGAHVTGYSLAPNTAPSLFNVLNLARTTKHNLGNILDATSLEHALSKCSPEIVFHLAAQPLVRSSYQEPKLTYETNVIGTINVLEAVRKCPSVKSCVVITTDKCYENKEWPYGYRENDPMGGYDPYSSSKACAELVVSAYRNSFFNAKEYERAHNVNLASARAGNVIGGGDWALDRLIPDSVKAIVKGEPLYLRNPGATRPWQHVLEPLSGYLWLGALMLQPGSTYSEAWNFGPYDESVISVESVVKQIIEIWKKGNYSINQEPQPHEAHLLKLDISKAQAGLGWKPVLNIHQAIQTTIEWYRQFYAGQDVRNLAIDQIMAYTDMARIKGVAWSQA